MSEASHNSNGLIWLATHPKGDCRRCTFLLSIKFRSSTNSIMRKFHLCMQDRSFEELRTFYRWLIANVVIIVVVQSLFLSVVVSMHFEMFVKWTVSISVVRQPCYPVMNNAVERSQLIDIILLVYYSTTPYLSLQVCQTELSKRDYVKNTPSVVNLRWYDLSGYSSDICHRRRTFFWFRCWWQNRACTRSRMPFLTWRWLLQLLTKS